MNGIIDIDETAMQARLLKGLTFVLHDALASRQGTSENYEYAAYAIFLGMEDLEKRLDNAEVTK